MLKLKGEDIYPSYQTLVYDFSTCQHNLFRLFHMKRKTKYVLTLQKYCIKDFKAMLSICIEYVL